MEGLSPNTGEEKKGFAKEKTNSPEIYINRFLKSDLFNKGRKDEVGGPLGLRGYESFIKELKSRRVEATNKEVKRVFLGMNEAKLLFLHFAKHELMFEYDEKFFCKKDSNVCGAFDKYKAIVKKTSSPRAGLELASLPTDIRRERIVEMDAERQFKHTQVLNALYESGYVPSKMIGRAMARIMLISEGLDTFERAQSDEEQRYRKLAGALSSRL